MTNNRLPFGIGDFMATFKGDSPGHPFRGNQFSSGTAGTGYVTLSGKKVRVGKGDKITTKYGDKYTVIRMEDNAIHVHETNNVIHASNVIAVDHQ